MSKSIKKNRNESKTPVAGDKLKPKDYTTKEIQSSITLIETPEHSIALEALLIVSKYADLSLTNLISLQSLGLIPKLLKQQFDRNLCICRLSLRLLSQLLTTDEGLSEMDQEIHNEKIQEITEMFVTSKDEFIRRFSLEIIERLSTTRRLFVISKQEKLLQTVFTSLQTQKEELVWLCTILFCRLIDVSSVIEDLKSLDQLSLVFLQMKKFKTTDISLEIYRKLAPFGLLDKLLTNFLTFVTDPNGIVLENQLKALRIVKIILDYTNNDNILIDLVKSLEFLEFCEWVKSSPTETFPETSIIFQKISTINSIKQLLFDLSVEDVFLTYLLRCEDLEILNRACKMVSNMTSHRYCCEKMLTPVVVKKLLKILESEAPNGALKALSDFSKRNTRTIHMLFQYKAHEVLFKLLLVVNGTVSEENYVKILEIFNLFLFHPRYKPEILTTDFYKLLLHKIKIPACLEMLIGSINEANFEKNFLELNGPEIIMENLTQTKEKTLQMQLFLLFIHNCLTCECIAMNFLHLKIISLLKSNLVLKEFALTEKILKILYNLFLPIKFFETNRLELTDNIVKGCFYLIKGPWTDPFPFLELLEFWQISTLNSIYVVDCSEKKSKTVCIKSINYGKLSHDPYLFDYVQKLLSLTTKCTCLESKIKIVAEFIDERMCGLAKDDGLLGDNFKLHIESIKYKLGTNMIPIGYLRVGFQCERGLLFKALADHLQIPATLVRNGKGCCYWNEVALIELGESGTRLRMFVVDLMDNIGELYPLGSKKCNLYCDIK